MILIDQHSETWMAVVEHAEQRLKEHREYLEAINTDHDKTQILRGRIGELKDLLSLAEGKTKRPINE